MSCPNIFRPEDYRGGFGLFRSFDMSIGDLVGVLYCLWALVVSIWALYTMCIMAIELIKQIRYRGELLPSGDHPGANIRVPKRPIKNVKRSG